MNNQPLLLTTMAKSSSSHTQTELKMQQVPLQHRSLHKTGHVRAPVPVSLSESVFELIDIQDVPRFRVLDQVLEGLFGQGMDINLTPPSLAHSLHLADDYDI